MLVQNDRDILHKHLKINNFYKVVQQETAKNHQKVNVDYGYLENFTNNLLFLRKNSGQSIIIKIDSVITIAEVENVKK